jgi:hypothetical protein
MALSIDCKNEITFTVDGQTVLRIQSEGATVKFWCFSGAFSVDQRSLRQILENVVIFSGYQGD